jgi:ribonuclease BN (tRNA processing enzyme)
LEAAVSEFEVLALGVGDTFSERHAGSSLLLCCDGFRLAIDCPDRYRAVLRHAADRAGRALSLSDIDHLLITHVHGDHMNGLEGVAFFKHFVDRRRLKLVAAPEVRAQIWPRLEASMGQLWDGQQLRRLGPEDYFEDIALSWNAPARIGPFEIRARQTLHHVPTSALLIEAAGRKLGYSADTAFDPLLLEFLAPADLIIHETNFGPAHTPYEALAALPPPLRAKLRLIHYWDGFDTDASVIPVVREGDVLRP